MEGADEGAFSEFYTEVKEIEARDSVLTPSQQIDRLLRPGSSYFNLNPFEVLQVDPDVSLEDAKIKYRRLSILVHPDKNRQDEDRARMAFDAVNKAWKTLENDDTRKRCLEIVNEAKERTEINIAEKKKKWKKDGKGEFVAEDPQRAVWALTMKLFADLERKKRSLETRDMEERKRKREAEIEEEEKTKAEREWNKNFEDSREGRVASWQNFSKAPVEEGKKKKRKPAAFRPPKHKAETR